MVQIEEPYPQEFTEILKKINEVKVWLLSMIEKK